MTEAQSYLALATSANVFQGRTPFTRTTTEDYALDSFQNLLFSIARFHEYTGSYPVQITVVGYEFKRARFMDLHRAALRWPIEKFHYIGEDPDDVHNSTAADGEVSYLPRPLDELPLVVLERKWLFAVFCGLIWMSLGATCQKTTKKSICPVSLVLYIISRAAFVIRLVPDHC
jgi:hypothetical protein